MRLITPARSVASPRLWREFSAPECTQATLEITGLGLYRAFLNGERVGRDYLTPGFNDYDAYLRAQTYDVTDLLREENRLEVWLGDGWYKGRIGFDGGRTCVWGDKYLLAARLTLTDTAGRQTVIETDENWLAAQSPIVDSSIYDGEVRDDTRPLGDIAACVPVDVPYTPEAQFSPCIRQVAELKPVLINTPAGEQVLDFGQNAAGILRFVNRLPYGARLYVQTGEVLQQGNFYRENLRTAKSEFTYISDGREKLVEETFTFHGFRYAKVQGLSPVNPDDFTMVVLSSDLKSTLEAGTDNPALNRLLLNSLWGQRSNFLDVPTDCPQRDERLGWTADTQVYVNTACYQMDCRAFYRKFMRDMREDQLRYYEGDIPAYSPSLRKQAIHGGAVWADAATIIPWNVYMAYGDTALLRENYPMMKDYCDYLQEQDRQAGGTHLVFRSFTFGDWLAQDGMTPQSLKGGTEDAFIQACYYLNSVELTAKAADVLEEGADVARLHALAGEIRAAINREYITPAGRLALDTQTAYVLALRFGIVRDKDKLIACFRNRIRKDFYRITCGFTGAPLMLPVLLENGMTDIAYRMLLTEEFPGWLYAVKLGATTVWERWNSIEADGSISGTGMNSLNHYAYGSVCEAVYAHIMGLKNAAPGWSKALIAPKLTGQLRRSRIAYDSVSGRWEVSWSIDDDGSVTMAVCVPSGCEAEVVLPDHPEGLRLTLTGGACSWHYQPAVDYMHPYSAQSLLMDLMANAQTAALLREKMPALAGAASGPDNDFKVMNPIEACYAMPSLNPADAFALDAPLKAIRR